MLRGFHGYNPTNNVTSGKLEDESYEKSDSSKWRRRTYSYLANQRVCDNFRGQRRGRFTSGWDKVQNTVGKASLVENINDDGL
jgi:hypothetical protein